MADAAVVRAEFRKLHESGCFVMPNPWDIGTARYLQQLGFRALATTSAGVAFSRGLPDAAWAVTRDDMLTHIASIVKGADLPVNADFESGYADEPEGVAQNVRLCIETGVSGLSIEDATGREEEPLYELALAVDRIRAARDAIDRTATGALLTGRAECYLVGHPKPFQESMRRLEAYAEAGADVLYAPGLSEPDEIKSLVDAFHPKPVNVLMSANTGLRVADLAALGVRRISVGSSLARAAWTGFIRAAREIVDYGTFGSFDGMTPYGELNSFFQEDAKRRR